MVLTAKVGALSVTLSASTPQLLDHNPENSPEYVPFFEHWFYSDFQGELLLILPTGVMKPKYSHLCLEVQNIFPDLSFYNDKIEGKITSQNCILNSYCLPESK